MLIMTAKVNKTGLVIAIGSVVAVIALLLMLFSSGGSEPTAVTGQAATNEDRIRFLSELGWQVSAAPAESSQIRIPREASQVFDRYNQLQKSQGYDLTTYGGKTVTRYVYQVTNYPDATEPVYATLLVHKDRIIGGDITDTAPGGKIRPLKQIP